MRSVVALGMVLGLAGLGSAHPAPPHHYNPAVDNHQSTKRSDVDNEGDYLWHLVQHIQSTKNLQKRVQLPQGMNDPVESIHLSTLKEMNDLYRSKYHKDDDYAKWASDPDLGRGKYKSRAIRQHLYQNPGRLVADHGVGKGKLWRSDDDGYIYDEGSRLNNLTAQEAEWMGLTPKRGLRLPERYWMRHEDYPDPTQTVDPPLPLPTFVTIQQREIALTSSVSGSRTVTATRIDPSTVPSAAAASLDGQGPTNPSFKQRQTLHSLVRRQGPWDNWDWNYPDSSETSSEPASDMEPFPDVDPDIMDTTPDDDVLSDLAWEEAHEVLTAARTVWQPTAEAAAPAAEYGTEGIPALAEGTLGAGAQTAAEAASAAAGVEAGVEAAGEIGAAVGAAAALLPVAAPFVAAGLMLFSVLEPLVVFFLMQPHHPKNPGGKLHWAFDVNNIPYQYDDKYPKEPDQPVPAPTGPPPPSCNSYDMEDLERRGWVLTQYAHAPCPVWIPKECSREWAEQWRSEVEDGSKSRRNPIYCFETVDLGFNAGQNRIQYESAKNQDHVAQYHQYSGNELVRLDGCLWSEKYGDGQMALNQKCRKRYLPFMKHHNIENKKCKKGASGLLCEQEENYWQHKTTGWPAGCLKSEPACWVHSVKRWLVGEPPVSTEVGPVLEPSWAAANTTNETSGSAEQNSTMASQHRG